MKNHGGAKLFWTKAVHGRLGVVERAGLAVAFFLACNLFRAWLLAGSVDTVVVQADYALPVAVAWAAARLRLRPAVTIAATVLTMALAIAADAVRVASVTYGWDLNELPGFVGALDDLPWRVVTPIAAGLALATLLACVPLLFSARQRFLLWPLAVLLLPLALIDAMPERGSADLVVRTPNLLTSSLLRLARVGRELRAGRAGPALAPFPGATLAGSLTRGPAPATILSVSVESLGIPRDPALAAAMLDPLVRGLGDRYRIEQGSHLFFGATLAGETRELCGARSWGVYALAARRRELGHCLPMRLARAGYDTVALHGNGGHMYDRLDVYPAMGFRRSLFFADLRREAPAIAVCKGLPFTGICDGAVFTRALALFDGRRRLVHVMTLDAHLPYSAENGALDQCLSAFRHAAGLCRYSALTRNSLGALASAVRSAPHPPDMIVVYGDHAPPFGAAALREAFRPGVVPYVVLTRRTLADRDDRP